MLIKKIRAHVSLTTFLISVNLVFAFVLMGIFLLKPAGHDYVEAWKSLNEKTANPDITQAPEIKKIALTFDDGPHPFYTEEILDILKEKGIKATFFIMGQNAEKYPEIVKRISDEGHLIGNHTYNHLQLNSRNFDKFQNELKTTNDLLEKITGRPVEFVRPPYGTWSVKFETRTDLLPILWTVDTLDWCTDDAQSVVRRIMNEPKNNDIILMHDCYKSTVTATDIVIDKLLGMGFSFVTADEILMD